MSGETTYDPYAQLRYKKQFKDLTERQKAQIKDFVDTIDGLYTDLEQEQELWRADLMNLVNPETAPAAPVPVAAATPSPASRAQFQVPGGPGGAGASPAAFSPASSPSLSLSPEPARPPASSPSLSLSPEPERGCEPQVQNYIEQYVTTLGAAVSKSEKEVQSLRVYLQALEELRQKLTQEKAVQCAQLTNVYEEAVKMKAPKPFVNMVKQIVDEATAVSDLKDEINATEWAQHEKRLMQTLSAVPLPGGRKRGRDADVEIDDSEGEEVEVVPKQVRVISPDQVVDLSQLGEDEEPNVAQTGPLLRVVKSEPSIKQESRPKKAKLTPAEQRAKQARQEQVKAKLAAEGRIKQLKLEEIAAKYNPERKEINLKLQAVETKLAEQRGAFRDKVTPLQELLDRLTSSVQKAEAKVNIRKVENEFGPKISELEIEKATLQSELNNLLSQQKLEQQEVETAFRVAKSKLSGGARHRKKQAKRAQKQLKKALQYCGCRSNAYYQSLLQKLMRDRQRHQDLMKELHYHAIKLLGGGAPMTHMLNQMAHDQKIYGARRTQLDAQQWSDVARKIKGGGCGYMLRAGGCCVTGCE